ncbi:MAG: GtrA family protein [Muribaculaceae bacterium]|nr:GtrA family protein [Muribaculaceae bacterium]MDE7458862.1 GtrA family protein [Muribaculaceae bacterium]
MSSNLIDKIKSQTWVLKAMATSQASAWVDFITSFVVFAVIGLSGGDAAAAGAIAGGVVNCTLNYKWTFRGSHCPVANVVIKYAMVWVGSLLLNAYGTEYLTDICLDSSLLGIWGISRNLRFTIARLTVSFLVSVFWNLLLQRTFVYRYVKFDNFLQVITTRSH